ETKSSLLDYKKKLGGDKNLANFLNRTGLGEKEFEDALYSNLLQEKLLDKLNGNISVSDQEILKFYQENTQAFAKKPFPEVKENIKDILTSVNKNKQIGQTLLKLRNEANIKILDDRFSLNTKKPNLK
ncbi:hypothetical protein JYT19_00960, partial [Sulfobacillus acidophilus]|nr:hypothetical protein [Sulfobacillus acidophilus]